MLTPSGMVWVHSEVKAATGKYKVVQSDHLYPVMKHFYPDRSDLSQDGNASIHKRGLMSTVWKWCESDAMA